MLPLTSGAPIHCLAAARAPTPNTGPQPAEISHNCSTSTTCTSKRSPSSGRSASSCSSSRWLHHFSRRCAPAQRSLVPIAAGAYIAWLVHAAYDWDWELPGVTIAALVCAGAVLAAARRQGSPVSAGAARIGLVLVVIAAGTLSLFGLLGNRALANTGDALRQGNVAAALSAAEDARRWAPWSSQPWLALAGVRRAQGDQPGELAAYRQAVAKDPRNWELWLDLVSISRGAERAHALAQLTRLNPGAAAGARGAP